MPFLVSNKSSKAQTQNNRLRLQPPWIPMSSFYIQPTISPVQALPPWSMWSPPIRFTSKKKTFLARCNVWIIHVRYSLHCHNVISAHFNYGSAVSERIWQRATRNYLRAHWLRLSRIHGSPSSSTSCSIVEILFSHAVLSVCVTCVSRIGHRSWPTPCDVYVEDVHRSHGKITVAQFAGSKNN